MGVAEDVVSKDSCETSSSAGCWGSLDGLPPIVGNDPISRRLNPPKDGPHVWFYPPSNTKHFVRKDSGSFQPALGRNVTPAVLGEVPDESTSGNGGPTFVASIPPSLQSNYP